MSISCQLCKQEICENEISKSFIFILGDLVNGIFVEGKTQYYHAECLNRIENHKVKKKGMVKM